MSLPSWGRLSYSYSLSLLLSVCLQHSVGVVFHGAKRPWQKGELKVFVDGQLKRSVAMKCPNLSDVKGTPLIIFILPQTFLSISLDVQTLPHWVGHSEFWVHKKRQHS